MNKRIKSAEDMLDKLADAIENDSFMDDYYYMAVDEYDLYDDLYAAGMDWNKFMYEK